MAPQEHVRKVESIIGHAFYSDQLINQALLAAGAENENHDGNRKLSQIGANLVNALVVVMVYVTGASRGESLTSMITEIEAMTTTNDSKESTTNVTIDFANKEHYAYIARQTGIADCIGYDGRPGGMSPSVLRKAVNAIIAAVFLDTLDIKITMGVMLRIFTRGSWEIKFPMLSHISTSAADSLSSGAKLLFPCWLGNMLQTNEATSGENMPCNSTLPDLQLESPATSLSATATSPTGPTGQIGAEKGPVDSILAVDVPDSSIGYADYLAMLPTPQVNCHISDYFDGHCRLPGSIESIEPNMEDEIALALNTELHGQPNVLHGQPSVGYHDNINPVLPATSSAADVMDRNRPPNYYGCKTVAESSESPRKQKRPTGNLSSPSLGKDQLQGYLFQERQKCESQGLLPPEETYFNPSVQGILSSLERRHTDAVATVLVTIGSSRSILALRDIIRSARVHGNQHSCCLRDGISPKERFDMIQQLDQKLAFIKLVKWCHILELFRESGGPEARSSTGYVVTTAADFEHQTKTFGNPINQNDTKVAQSMMMDIFPDLLPSAEGYQRKFLAVKKLRKLGKRLHTLASKFGTGVFGLILDCEPTSNSMMISENMISRSDETTFEAFVDILEVSQGNNLRTFSTAILPMQDTIAYSTLQQTRPFALEEIDTEEILKQAKGSEGLLRLLG